MYRQALSLFALDFLHELQDHHFIMEEIIMARKQQRNQLHVPLEEATGRIDYPLTDDMVFHMIMQKSNRALKGLVCALKGLDPLSVKEVVLTNEVDYNTLGKEIILDVRVLMNDNEVMNLELQVYRDEDWIKRSLLYLSRAYDTIGEGVDYSKLLPTTHIGIMGYDLFPDAPEFYARYLMTNVRTGGIYSPIFGINVLSLNQIQLATQADRANGLDYWAKLFKTETWDELRTLAEKRDDFREVMDIMFEVNSDSKQRAALEARRKYREVVTTQKNKIDRLEKALEESQQRIAELEALLAAKS